tara:strand:- start:103 stop:600 length:498 start_codon:yes stop_codon:yes gene_type:complete
MIFDATFWVAISFIIFVAILFYFKIHIKIQNILDENINNIKNQIENAEKLKEEAKSVLSENEKKLSISKNEIKEMINRANEEVEKNIIKTNNDFHNLMEVRKKNTDMKIKQMKEQAIRDIKNASINIGFKAVERLMSKSLDKSKLDKLYNDSVEETKLALKKNSS